jgi:sodium/potassium-transporting ATPase subunit alpha
MLLEGTLEGVVFQVGKNTVMARIADLTQSQRREMTTMEREVNLFAILIGCIGVFGFFLTFFVWLAVIRQQHPMYLNYTNVLVASMSCLVSVIPEGLQVAVTMTLTLVAKKMKNLNVLVKKLSIIETLGSTTVIASDKTGTITQNRMTLANLFICGHETYRLITETGQQKAFSPAYALMMKLAGLCNKAIQNKNHDAQGEQEFIGSPTECGILKSIMQHIAVDQVRLQNPTVFEIPFNSRYKYMATVHRLDKTLIGPELVAIGEIMHNSTHLVIMKGKRLVARRLEKSTKRSTLVRRLGNCYRLLYLRLRRRQRRAVRPSAVRMRRQKHRPGS